MTPPDRDPVAALARALAPHGVGGSLGPLYVASKARERLTAAGWSLTRTEDVERLREALERIASEEER